MGLRLVWPVCHRMIAMRRSAAESEEALVSKAIDQERFTTTRALVSTELRSVEVVTQSGKLPTTNP